MEEMRWYELFHVCDGGWSSLAECPACGGMFYGDPPEGATSCACGAGLFVECRSGWWRIRRVDGPDATCHGDVYSEAVLRGLGSFLAARIGWTGRGLERAADSHAAERR